MDQTSSTATSNGAAGETAAPAPVRKTTRRNVLTVAAVAAAGAATGVGTPAVLNHLASRNKPARWRFLTDAEATLLEAVCEQIIPADQDPGAKEAGCVNFIDRQLVGPYRHFAGRYRAGLASLIATCQALHNKPFEQLSWDEQTRLLEKLEAGEAPKEHWKTVSASEFFRLVCDHTMQGFYGSPRHGGNKDYASYRMLGIEYPRVIGRNKA